MAGSKPENVSQALLAVQKAGVTVVKDSKNPHFKNTYASLGAVIEALKPELDKNDLLVMQAPTFADGALALSTTIVHAPSGEQWSDVSPLIVDKDNMQGLGSAITYARRYALVSIFFLDADEDDDGNAASTMKEKVDAARVEAGPAPRTL